MCAGCDMGINKLELTELKEKDACCPKDKKMEVEENKNIFYMKGWLQNVKTKYL